MAVAGMNLFHDDDIAETFSNFPGKMPTSFLTENSIFFDTDMVNVRQFQHLTAFSMNSVNHQRNLKALMLLHKHPSDTAGVTELHIAAGCGNVSEVKFRVKQQDQYVNGMTKSDKYTPLQFALAGNHIEVIKVLLEGHASPNMYSNDGYSSVMAACERDMLDALKLLIVNKRSWNIQTKDKRTLLHIAASTGSTEMFQYLIDIGLKPDASTLSGVTPLIIAVEKGHLDMVKLMVNDLKVSVSSTFNAHHIVQAENITALHLAAQNGHNEIVQILIASGADVNAITSRKESPLHLAARNGNLQIVAELLKYQADVNLQDVHQCSISHYAAISGNLEVVKLLVHHKANPKVIDRSGMCPIHISTRLGFLDIFKLLISKHSGAEITNLIEEGLLHLAVKSGRLAMVYILDDEVWKYRNVDNTVRVKSIHHTKTVDLKAEDAKDEENDGLLLQWTILHCAVHYDVYRVTESLARQKVYKEIKTENIVKGKIKADFTPLHLAVVNKNQKIMEILLRNGYPVNSWDINKMTPLHYAAYYGLENHVNLLLKNLAAVNIDGKHSITPLHLAARWSHVIVAKILLKNGANVNAVITGNVSVLHLAARFGNAAMVKLLIENGAYIDERRERKPEWSPMEAAEMNTAAGVHDMLEMANSFYDCVVANDLHKLKEHIKAHNWLSNCSTKAKGPVLLVAASVGNLPMTKALLQAKANVRAALDGGKMAIHLAAENNHYGVVLALLKHASYYDPKIEPSQMTPLEIAQKKGHRGIVELMTLCQECFENVRANNKEVINKLRMLKQFNTDYFVAITMATHSSGVKLLPYSMRCGNSEVMNLLAQLLKPTEDDSDQQGRSASAQAKHFSACKQTFGARDQPSSSGARDQPSSSGAREQPSSSGARGQSQCPRTLRQALRLQKQRAQATRRSSSSRGGHVQPQDDTDVLTPEQLLRQDQINERLRGGPGTWQQS